LLAYTYIDNDICINELLIKEGYVKPYDKFYCENINKYRQLNFFAKTEKVGLYQKK
jgi:micrococcal nuclease